MNKERDLGFESGLISISRWEMEQMKYYRVIDSGNTPNRESSMAYGVYLKSFNTSSLVDMYSGMGEIEYAKELFYDGESRVVGLIRMREGELVLGEISNYERGKSEVRLKVIMENGKVIFESCE